MGRRTDLAVRLNYARCALGLSLVDAAAQIGVARNTVASWESGATVPGVAVLDTIARVYGIDRGELAPMRERASRTRVRQRKNGTEAAA